MTELVIVFSRLFCECAYRPIIHPTTKKNLEDTEKGVSDEKNVTVTCLRCIQTLLPWRNKCFNAKGDYVEVCCVVLATLCHAHIELRVHFSALVYVPCFITPLHESSV